MKRMPRSMLEKNPGLRSNAPTAWPRTSGSCEVLVGSAGVGEACAAAAAATGANAGDGALPPGDFCGPPKRAASAGDGLLGLATSEVAGRGSGAGLLARIFSAICPASP